MINIIFACVPVCMCVLHSVHHTILPSCPSFLKKACLSFLLLSKLMFYYLSQLQEVKLQVEIRKTMEEAVPYSFSIGGISPILYYLGKKKLPSTPKGSRCFSVPGNENFRVQSCFLSAFSAKKISQIHHLGSFICLAYHSP